MSIIIHFLGEFMSIELKYRFKYSFTVMLFAVLSLILGMLGIAFRIKGIFFIPIISATLATLFAIEKRKISFSIISTVLIVAEFLYGNVEYYCAISLSSIIIAIIISVCYLKRVDKCDTVIYSTASASLFLVLIGVLYLLGVFEGSALKDVINNLLLLFERMKEGVIKAVTDAATLTGNLDNMLSKDEISDLLNVYLDVLIALIVILAFAIVGFTCKIFSALMRRYERSSDHINSWSFIPPSLFAYFYFIVALFSAFVHEPGDAISVSVLNLYLIFLFVFAYVGYKFITGMFRAAGHHFAGLPIILITVLFSSFMPQFLAVIGAFTAIKHSKIPDSSNSNDIFR